MKNAAVIITLLLTSFCTLAAFAETSIDAEVNKTSITIEDSIIYKLTITSTEKEVSSPTVPAFEGFSLISQVQSSNVSLVNGEIKTSLVHTYILFPDKTGMLKIEPSKIKIGNTTLSSEAFEIEVKAGEIEPQPEEDLPLPEEIQPESEQPVRITI